MCSLCLNFDLIVELDAWKESTLCSFHATVAFLQTVVFVVLRVSDSL